MLLVLFEVVGGVDYDLCIERLDVDDLFAYCSCADVNLDTVFVEYYYSGQYRPWPGSYKICYCDDPGYPSYFIDCLYRDEHYTTPVLFYSH